MGRADFEGEFTASENMPPQCVACTRSPMRAGEISSPTASMTPAHSLPGMKGSGGLSW